MFFLGWKFSFLSCWWWQYGALLIEVDDGYWWSKGKIISLVKRVITCQRRGVSFLHFHKARWWYALRFIEKNIRTENPNEWWDHIIIKRRWQRFQATNLRFGENILFSNRFSHKLNRMKKNPFSSTHEQNCFVFNFTRKSAESCLKRVKCCHNLRFCTIDRCSAF